MIGLGRLGCEKDKASALCGPLGLEICPGAMADKRGFIGVIHPRPPQSFIIPNEAAGLNDVHGQGETSTQAQDGPDILGDVWLEKNKVNQSITSYRAVCFDARQRPFHGQ